MKDPSSRCLPQAPGVRVLTLILMVLLFSSEAVYSETFDPSPEETALSQPGTVPAGIAQSSPSLPEASVPGPLLEKTPSEKMVFALEEGAAKPESLDISGADKKDPKKLDYKFGVQDSTGRGTVRTSNAKVGVDYRISKNAVLGVEASQEIHDSGDAAAWGRSADDETAARAKYKIVF